MAFRHLKLSDRKNIEALLQKCCSQAAIARILLVHRSTVKKEVDRNSVQGVYKAEAAERLALSRKKENRKPYLSPPAASTLRIRTQDDNRILRPERRRLTRPGFDWIQTRAWLWSRRDRYHIWEGFARTARDWRDWLRYNYRSTRYMRFYKGNHFISKYERICRTFLGKLPSRYYRVNPFARFFKVPPAKLPFPALPAMDPKNERVDKKANSGHLFSNDTSPLQTNDKTRVLQANQPATYSFLTSPAQNQPYLSYDQIICISEQYQQRYSGRLSVCIKGHRVCGCLFPNQATEQVRNKEFSGR